VEKKESKQTKRKNDGKKERKRGKFYRFFYLDLGLPTYLLPECLGKCMSLMVLTLLHSVCRAREQRR